MALRCRERAPSTTSTASICDYPTKVGFAPESGAKADMREAPVRADSVDKVAFDLDEAG
jgi:hypothetical protein